MTIKFFDLPREERWAIVARYEQGGIPAVVEDAAQLEVRVDSLARYIRREQKQLRDGKRDGIIDESALPGALRTSPATYSEDLWEYNRDRYEALSEMLGRDPARPPLPAAKKRGGNTRRVVAMSDWHGRPYIAGIERMLERERPDRVALLGDLLQCAAFSPWGDAMDEQPKEELARVEDGLNLLNGTCGDVDVGLGNHEAWIIKYFAKRVEKRFLWMVDLHLLDTLCQKFENVHLVRNLHGFETPTGVRFDNQFETRFMMRLGDAVLGHPNRSRKHPGATARAAWEWYDKWRRPLGWPDPGLMVIAHSHKGNLDYSQVPYLAEIGIMGEPAPAQSFAMNIRISAGPPTLGYITFDQHRVRGEWVTDLGSVRPQPVLRPSA